MQQLIADYVAGVDLLRRAVAGLTVEQLRARPVPGKWSTLEVVCHIADFDPILADRMKRIIALEAPLMLGADENEFTRKLAYQDRDLDEELALIDVTRKQMARILATLPAETFQRTGTHSVRGPQTLETVLGMAARHIPHHIAFIEEKRRVLGV